MNHSQCKQERSEAVQSHRAPAAVVVARVDNTVARKEKVLAAEKRMGRKVRKRRAKRERVVASDLQDMFGRIGDSLRA